MATGLSHSEQLKNSLYNMVSDSRVCNIIVIERTFFNHHRPPPNINNYVVKNCIVLKFTKYSITS
jgi:hypothetical protein